MFNNPTKTPVWAIFLRMVTQMSPKLQTIFMSSHDLQSVDIHFDKADIFIHKDDMVPLEQKGCKPGAYEYKNLLFINSMIFENCFYTKKSVNTSWINYTEAFDNVRHSWI